jgi:hypothetical protein
MKYQATRRAGVETNEGVLSPQRRRDAEVSAENALESQNNGTFRGGAEFVPGLLSVFSALISASLRLCGERHFS